MKNVVVIDDDRDVREVIVYALENDGFNVLSFDNGKEGLDGLSKLDVMPGLIIVDYLMPEMDGVTFINQIREKYPDTLSQIPIALSSAMGSMGPELKHVEGLIHLNKPMNLDDLLMLVSKHCS